jgi:mannose-6-phosphate isomerase-like protein (cupin superfamily)
MGMCSHNPARRGGRKGINIVTTDGKGMVLLPGEGETISMPGNKMSFVHREPDSAYSIVEWVAEPGPPGSSVHIHRLTDEALYVLEGTFGLQLGEETVEASAGGIRVRARGDHARVLDPGTLAGKDACYDVPARVRAVS